MTDPGQSPADQVTGKTVRAGYDTARATPSAFASGKKYRVVVKRKQAALATTRDRTQAEALQDAAEEGAAFCKECQQAQGPSKARSQGTLPSEASPTVIPAPPASPPTSTPADRKAASQADALVGAAQQGAAFCQECQE